VNLQYNFTLYVLLTVDYPGMCVVVLYLVGMESLLLGILSFSVSENNDMYNLSIFYIY
jgi:hypothetical protein